MTTETSTSADRSEQSARMPRKQGYVWFVALCGMAVVLLVALWTTGVLIGKIDKDTAGYFSAATSNSPWSESRHPLYGWLAGHLGAGPSEPGGVALVQAILHLCAALALYAGVCAAGVGAGGAFCLAAAALLSQSGLFHLRFVIPESPAIAFLEFAFAGTLAASRSALAYRLLLAPIGFAVGIACLLRPTFLPAVLVVPALWWLFAIRNGQTPRAARTILLALVVALPILLQSGVRQRAVGDFNIVSFGGFQMSAMAGFMLTPETIERLPERVNETARAILGVREAGEADGRVARTPLNSVGERSFVSAALGYFDVYARSYDEFLFAGIGKLQGVDETWIAFNKRLLEFSIAAVLAEPLRWAAWVGGATARLAGRSVVTNATMLAAIALLVLVSVPAWMQGAALGRSKDDLAAVTIVALAWVACTAPLIVLVTFPATRYIDSAALLLPAIPAALGLAMIEGLAAGPAFDVASVRRESAGPR